MVNVLYKVFDTVLVNWNRRRYHILLTHQQGCCHLKWPSHADFSVDEFAPPFSQGPGAAKSHDQMDFMTVLYAKLIRHIFG